MSVYDLLPESWDKQDIAIGEGSDGTIILSAIRGKGIGPTIKFMPEWGAFGWFRSDDQVEWEITVDKSGMFLVEMEWSVSDEEAGKPFILKVKGNELRGEVGKTGSWETFATKDIGQIMLQDGKQTVVFKPDSTFGIEQALLDIRKISFTPISRKVH